ncbi:hypothetical protein NCCP2716_25710 [Sporosarcina sp. NCCP-2716]|uniref:hypothetical protein n=1 Tax=Sporosarcina sp. NCCP-2716 TaxID=2943679 RepID=UPI002041D1B5|nr:hypothetical protein [Sporosarcina sp. NCCP-2716]GKV70073.1 hypothetical protein NCCP2716_25710 [Sporosarcina sp. NCCP-2716]
MKKSILLLLILCTLILASCGETSTSSSFVVIEKGQSNNKECWIRGYNPNIPNKKEPFKIVVKEKMVWNIIEEEVDYFVTYSDNENNRRVLEDIQR